MTIQRMNEIEGVGVLLTSHDAGDIEALCRRVIIVNHGEIVYRDKVSALKRRYLTVKTVDVRLQRATAAGLQPARCGDAQGGALRRQDAL